MEASARAQAGCRRLQRPRRNRWRDILAQRLRDAYRGIDVHDSGALLHERRAGQRLCRVLQDGLHQGRRQAGIRLKHGRHRAGHDGRRNRRAAQQHQAGVAPAL